MGRVKKMATKAVAKARSKWWELCLLIFGILMWLTGTAVLFVHGWKYNIPAATVGGWVVLLAPIGFVILLTCFLFGKNMYRKSKQRVSMEEYRLRNAKLQGKNAFLGSKAESMDVKWLHQPSVPKSPWKESLGGGVAEEEELDVEEGGKKEIGAKLEVEVVFSAKSARVKCCLFHPIFDDIIVASFHSGPVALAAWNIRSGNLVARLLVADVKGPKDSTLVVPMRALAWFQIEDEMLLVCGSDDGCVRLVHIESDVERGKEAEESRLLGEEEGKWLWSLNLKGDPGWTRLHRDYVRCLEQGPHGLLVSCGDDCIVNVHRWEKESWSLIAKGAVDHYCMCSRWLPDPTRQVVATGSLDGTLRVWGVEDGQLEEWMRLEGHGFAEGWEKKKLSGCNTLLWHCDASNMWGLLSGGDDHTVRGWPLILASSSTELLTPPACHVSPLHRNNVSALALVEGWGVSVSEDAQIMVFDPKTLRFVAGALIEKDQRCVRGWWVEGGRGDQLVVGTDEGVAVLALVHRTEIE